MEAQLWFSKGEKMEAQLGFSMDGVLVGCWVTLSYKKYMGQPLTITHKLGTTNCVMSVAQ